MGEDHPNSKRDKLGFVDAVRAQLEPLLGGCGLVCVELSSEIARFESSRVILSLSHHAFSYELELAIAAKDQPDRRFSLEDVLEAAIGPNHSEPTFFQASSADQVSDCVSAIKRLLRHYGDWILRGEPDAFQQIAHVADRRSRRLTNRIVNEPIRQAAETAWRSKDYTKVKKLYESIQGELTHAEAKRLDYAARHSRAE